MLPLHQLETAINRKLGHDTSQRIKTIYPFIVLPWWEPPEARIDDTHEEAIKAIEPRGDNPYEATIYTDNQAAIRATCQPGRSSGQYIIRRIVRHLGLLRDNRSRWRVRLQWDPGHEGVPGNEKADQLAKLAAVEATQRTQENARIARINAPNQTTPHAARMLCKVVEGPTASLSNNQRANEDSVAAARRITTGLEFGVDPTTN
ncbi:hypothetical protein TSTA_107430, partial [Talaromyces stipitatus ATCC 10500]